MPGFHKLPRSSFYPSRQQVVTLGMILWLQCRSVSLPLRRPAGAPGHMAVG
jgi:hypothetical protein